MPDKFGAAIILHLPAQGVGVEHRLLWPEFLGARLDRLEHHRLPHFCRGFFAEESRVRIRKFAVGELNQQPARHVIGADGETAGRERIARSKSRFIQQLLVAQTDNRAVDSPMRAGPINCGKSRLIVVRRVKHAGGFENIVLGEGFPSLCGHLLDQLTGRHVEHVVVGKAVTKTGRRFDVAQTANRLFARQIAARNEQKVTRAQSQAAAVGQQVAYCHLTSDPWIVHAEIGHVINHLVVPIELALIREDGEGGDGESFPGRSGLKNGIWPHALRLPEFADAVAFGQCRAAILDDGDGDAGNA